MNTNKKHTLAFANWLLKNDYEAYEKDGKEFWGKFYEEKDFTTEQLYDIWFETAIVRKQIKKVKDPMIKALVDLEVGESALQSVAYWLTICRSSHPSSYLNNYGRFQVRKIDNSTYKITKTK